MSTTREIVNRLVQKHKGWNADGPRGVLPLLNVAHEILTSSRGEQSVFLDETNGRLPYFNTTEGDRDYTFSTIREVKYILVEVGVSGSVIETISGTDYGMRASTKQPIDYLHFGGIDYMRVRYVRSWPATPGGANARISFLVDPGTTSDVYQYLGYRLPTYLSSLDVQHDVPPPYDSIYLEPAADLLITGMENGTYADAINVINTTIAKNFMSDMGRGEQGMCFEADPRGY